MSMFPPPKSRHCSGVSWEHRSCRPWCAYTMRGTRGMLPSSFGLHKMLGVSSMEKDIDLRGILNAAFSSKYMALLAKRSNSASSESIPYNFLKPRVIRLKLLDGYDASRETSYTV